MIWIFRFFDFLSVVLPVKLVYFASELIGILTYCFGLYPKGRRRAVKNLKQAGISSCGLSSFVSFARNITEFMMIPKLNRKNLCRWIEPVRIDRLETELNKGKGVILLAAHFGAWDLAGAAVSVMGYPINAVSIRYRNKAMADFYEKRRAGKGIRVIYIGQVRSMIRALRRGEILAILGDKVYSGEGVDVQFFGKAAKFPLGAFWLAQRTQASIVPVFCIHEKGRARLCFENPIEELSQYVSIFERYIRRYPAEWCTFDAIWET